MLGAPEVISMNALLIKSLGGKKVLDVGVYTGASSLGAALALPDGEYKKLFCMYYLYLLRWNCACTRRQ